MRFNVKRTQVKVVEKDGLFYVKYWGCIGPLIHDTGMTLTIEQLKSIFTPANLEALDLVEPDRNEKICQRSGREDPNFYKRRKR